MVKYQEAELNDIFAALADPTRRALLARLEGEDALSISALAQPFDVSLPAVMKHLNVLSDAGLVTREKTGRTVSIRLQAEPMAHAMEWLSRYEHFWAERLDRLAAFVEAAPDVGPAPETAQSPKRRKRPKPTAKKAP
ncbi:MAG: metalloregulator ArsR/SmtB family transcription factor [Thalassospira sp.]|uniref:ArsR/SmtB family transcription factor n=1 Tax=Thalassospira sp. TaxID=1912094 RepID=UPI0032F08801